MQRLLPVSALVLLAGLGASQTSLYPVDGQGMEALGHSVRMMGDITGDGRAETIVGAPWADGDQGRAYVLDGLDGSIIRTFFGSAFPDRFGESVSGAGDVDGDGTADVIVGAIRKAGLFVNKGYARVYSGADSSLLYSFSGSPAFAGDNFGISVSDAGDVDADGRADVMVGADEVWAGKPGQVYVYSGLDGSELFRVRGLTAFGRLGGAIASAGDLNGDGHTDLLLGAPELYDTSTGYLVVISGKGALDLGVPVVDLANPLHQGAVLVSAGGTSAEEWFAASVDLVGDVDGDGQAEIVAGSPQRSAGPTHAGRVTLLSGAGTLRTHEGTAPFDQLGISVAGVGDVDLDGFPDYLAGAKQASGWAYIEPQIPTGTGTARLYSGADGGELPLAGDQQGETFGYAVHGGGDANGDGNPDFVVAAPLRDSMNGRVTFFTWGSAVSAYGVPCPGTGGIAPTLSVSCGLTDGSPLTLEVDGGLGGSLAFVLMGAGPGSADTGLGCSVLVAPVPAVPTATIALTGSLPGEGAGVVSTTLPPGSSGSVLSFQALVADPGAGGLVSGTAGCLLTIP